MEIPGNEFRVKSKVIQDRVKVSGKESAKTNQLDSSGNKGAQEPRILFCLPKRKTSKNPTRLLKALLTSA